MSDGGSTRCLNTGIEINVPSLPARLPIHYSEHLPKVKWMFVYPHEIYIKTCWWERPLMRERAGSPLIPGWERTPLPCCSSPLPFPPRAFLFEAQPVRSCASQSINTALMKTLVDLSKDIDECSSIVLIFSVREEMKAVSESARGQPGCSGGSRGQRERGDGHRARGPRVHFPTLSPFLKLETKATASAGRRGEIAGRYLTFQSLSFCQ